jgi:hypothetical protein
LSEQEDTELAVQSLRGPVLIATDGFASREAEAALRRSLELAGRRDPDLQLPAAFGLAAMLEIRGEYRESHAVLERHLPAQECDGRYAAEWHHLLACSTFHQGQFAAALHHAQTGLTLSVDGYSSDLLRDYGEHPRIECHAWAALALWFLGYPDQALAHARKAAALVEAPQHSPAPARGQREPDTRRNRHRIRQAAGYAVPGCDWKRDSRLGSRAVRR